MAKWVIYWGNVLICGLLYLIIFSVSVVLLWYWIVSTDYHFLALSQLETVKNLMFGALATNFGRDFIENHKE